MGAGERGAAAMEDKAGDAIVLASFGASDAESRRDYIDGLTQCVREAFPERGVYHALTSAFILKKLQSAGEAVYSLAEILERLRRARCRAVAVQPTLLSAGAEYETKILAVARRFRADFSSLAVGAPAIVPGENDRETLEALLWQAGALAADEEAVFMGHGSADRHNPLYEALQSYADLHGSQLTVGVLEESDRPNFQHVLRRLREKGRKRVYLMPLLFAAGFHVLRDMSGGRDSWKSRLQDAGFAVRTYEKGLGVNPLFREIYLRKLRFLTKYSQKFI